MKMNSSHPNWKIKETQFKSKITQEEIDLIKSMKSDGKTFLDVYYVLLQRHCDPITKEFDPGIRTLLSWARRY